jgi:hypothetical protein
MIGAESGNQIKKAESGTDMEKRNSEEFVPRADLGGGGGGGVEGGKS